jgi:hypothetical protein
MMNFASYGGSPKRIDVCNDAFYMFEDSNFKKSSPIFLIDYYVR